MTLQLWHALSGTNAMQVNLKLFLTAPTKNKTVLLIVIRDRTKTPHEKICGDMRRDLDTIWGSLVKPPEFADSPLDEFFDLQYVSLPSYELEEDDFRAECTLLRRRFLPDTESTYIRPDESKVLPPAPKCPQAPCAQTTGMHMRTAAAK